MLAIPPTGSAAAQETISFDDFPPSTTITNQYESRGGLFGVTPQGSDSQTLYISSAPGLAHSGDRVLAIGGGTNEFPASSVWGRLRAPSRSVSAYVGARSTSGARTFVLEVYDVNGTLVGTDQKMVVGGAPLTSQLTVTTSTDAVRIAYFNIRDTSPRTNSGLIDDLRFDAPTGPPRPDFALLGGEREAVALGAGRSRQLTYTVRRLNGSTGPISLAASSTTPGVTATLSSDRVTGGDGERVTLTLHAARDAPAASGRVVLTGTPGSASAGTEPRVVATQVDLVGAFDLRVKNIEVTQGAAPPGDLPRLAGAPNTRRHHGPELARDGKTIARVYVDVTGGPGAGVPHAAVQLSALDGDTFRSLPGGPIGPVGGPSRVTASANDDLRVSEDDRVGDVHAFSFVLPPEWTARRRISLLASVRPPVRIFAADPEYRQCAEPACSFNDNGSLTDIRFVPTRTVTVDVLDLDTANDIGRLPALSTVFAVPTALTPLGDGQLRPVGPRAVIRNRDSDLNQAVSEWRHANATTSGDYTMGVENLAPGDGGGQAWDWDRTAIASLGRPVTALGHEWFHLLGRRHASDACSGGDPTKDDTDAWPPDNTGRMQGVALDRRGWGHHAHPFRLISDAHPGPQAWDLMSYCSGDQNGWVSPRNWTAVLNGLGQPGMARRARTTAAVPALHVTAEIRGQAAAITGIERVQRAPAAAATHPGYAIVALDGAGRELARAVPSGGTASDGGSVILQASLPPNAYDAARIELRRGATTLAQRVRSRPPRLRLRTPRRGTHLRTGRALTVGWSASDPDGDRLTARIEHSRDDGRTWALVGMTAGEQSMRLPGRLLGRSTRGRMRVTVGDGWNETAVRSARLRVDGSPPQVSIDKAAGSIHVRADGTLYLSGRAQDDRFRLLSGRALTWRLGRRMLGRGERLAATGALLPGRHAVALEARDRFGRRARARTSVRVAAVQPRFEAVRAPRTVARRARSVVLRLRTNVAAELRVGKRRHTLDRRLRRVRVPLSRRGKRVTIPLRLRAGSLGSYQAVTVTRR